MLDSRRRLAALAILGLCGLPAPAEARAATEAELAERVISVCVQAHLAGDAVEPAAVARGFQRSTDAAWPRRVAGETAFVWRSDRADVAVVVDPARPSFCSYDIRGDVDLPVLFEAFEVKLQAAGLIRYGGDDEGAIRDRWHRSEEATAMLAYDMVNEEVGGWVSDRRREPAAGAAANR